MPQQGAEIDIITGRPLAKTQAEKEDAARVQEEARLKQHAQYAELLQTPPGEKLLSLILFYLQGRIAELVQADPQSQAYVKILTDLGAKEAVGRKAAETLMNRYLKRKETP
jgi:hypothetical protein